MTGKTIGPYVVLEKIGAGGMGEVYVADDTRLRRRVALKMLSAEAVGDAVAAERLIREARAAGRLDHPNICTVFDVGEAEGHPYIAMQLVEGETLSARSRRPLAIRDAVSICAQIARALAAAHDQGIVHRDVKPQNVMVNAAGHVKVLDFGLAQAVAPVGGHETTVARLTDAGVIAGTIGYMSPEQLQGKSVDARSDIFSLGAVIYELIAGAHPFGNSSAADTIAAILTHTPPDLPESVPAELRRITFKCLERDRERRYQSARDLAVDLDAVFQERLRLTANRGRSRTKAAAAVLIAGIAGVSFWLWLKGSDPAVTGADFIQLTNFADSAAAPAISPDGTMLAFLRDDQAFLSRGGVYIKRLPNGEAKQLTADPRSKYDLQFSPDGNSVVYTVNDRGWHTWRVPIVGGDGVRMLPNAAGLSWIDAEHLLFSEIRTGQHMGVVTSTATRADQRDVYFPAHERAMAHYSAISPDRKSVLVVEMDKTGGWDSCRLVPFDGQQPMRLVGPPGSCRAARWSPDGNWMFFAVFDGVASHLWRQRFPDGKPEALTSGTATDEQGLAIAPDGHSLITSVGSQSSALWLHTPSDERILSPEGFAEFPLMSRDGKRVYCLLRRVGATNRQLAVIHITDGRTDDVLAGTPVASYALSADETTVAYVTLTRDNTRQIWTAALDRRSAPRLIVDNADNPAFGRDGWIAFRSLGQQANYLERIAPDGSGRTRVTEWPISTLFGTSPDGLWAVVRRPVPGSSVELENALVPLTGGEAHRLCCPVAWSGDGRYLYLLAPSTNRSLVIPLAPGRSFPDFPADGSAALASWETNVPGTRWINALVSRGSDPVNYVYVKRDDRRNLFRIPIR